MVMRLTTPLAKETWLRFDFSSPLYLGDNIGATSSFLVVGKNFISKEQNFYNVPRYFKSAFLNPTAGALKDDIVNYKSIMKSSTQGILT